MAPTTRAESDSLRFVADQTDAGDWIVLDTDLQEQIGVADVVCSCRQSYMAEHIAMLLNWSAVRTG